MCKTVIKKWINNKKYYGNIFASVFLEKLQMKWTQI